MSNMERSRKHDVSYGKFFDDDDDFVTVVKQPSKQKSQPIDRQPRGEKRKTNVDDPRESKNRLIKRELMPVLERFDEIQPKDTKKTEIESGRDLKSPKKPPKILAEGSTTCGRTKCSLKDTTDQVNVETSLKPDAAVIIIDDDCDDMAPREAPWPSLDNKGKISRQGNMYMSDNSNISNDIDEEQDSEQENQKNSTVSLITIRTSKTVVTSPKSSANSSRATMKWKPPAMISDRSCQKNKSLNNVSCFSANTGLRLGLSRNAPRIKSLHANVKTT